MLRWNMFYLKFLLSFYKLLGLSVWLVLYILIGDLKFIPMSESDIPRTAIYEAYIAQSVALELKDSTQNVLKEITKEFDQRKKEKKIKPNPATLACCDVLLKSYVTTLHEQKLRNKVVESVPITTNILKGYYVEVNLKSHAELIVAACDTVGEIDSTEEFVKTAKNYGEVVSFNCPDYDLPFGGWDREISATVQKVPTKSCSQPFFLRKKQKFLVFCISSRTQQFYDYTITDSHKADQLYRYYIEVQENTYSSERKFACADSMENDTFAVAILRNGEKVIFTKNDLKQFRRFYKRKSAYKEEEWSILFKKAILKWLDCHYMGLLDGTEFMTLYDNYLFYDCAQEYLELAKQKNTKKGNVFKVDMFVFNAGIGQNIVTYLNTLIQNKTKSKVIKQELDRLTAEIGNRKSHNVIYSFKDNEMIIDTKGNIVNDHKHQRHDIGVGDVICKNTVRSTYKEKARGEVAIMIVKQCIACDKIA